MLDIDTFAMGFPNGRIFCVGHKIGIDNMKKYFDNRDKHEHVKIDKLIDIAVQDKVYMCVMPNNTRDEILNRTRNMPILKELHILISFDAYVEAKCFSENGKKEVMELLNITEDEISDIVHSSAWNKVLKCD